MFTSDSFLRQKFSISSLYPKQRVQKGDDKPKDYSHGIRSSLGKLRKNL